jgi:DNA replicative helicase MCM subunit Mcm2 (Cdc46/Mcm family)
MLSINLTCVIYRRDFATIRHPTDLTERPTHINNEDDLEQDIHVNAKWVTGSGRIPQSFLKKYINYARRHSHPELRLHDEAKLARFYSEIRQASLVGGGIPMTVRHLESIIRMACANAKFRLASVVTYVPFFLNFT